MLTSFSADSPNPLKTGKSSIWMNSSVVAGAAVLENVVVSAKVDVVGASVEAAESVEVSKVGYSVVDSLEDESIWRGVVVSSHLKVVDGSCVDVVDVGASVVVVVVVDFSVGRTTGYRPFLFR